MQLRMPIRLAAVLAVLLASTLAFAGAPAPDKSTAKYEIKFMTDMIDHHSMAVMMAEACLSNAVHPELLTLCQNIKTAQMQEIAELQTWLNDWYGISYMPEMNPGMMHQIEHMSAMSGTEFEMMFMKTMIRHHWQAVIEASHCTERAYHADLKQLCSGIVTTQLQEIDMMQQWLCEWYGMCNFGPNRHAQEQVK